MTGNGEDDFLGGIATMSFGGDATMRVKGRWYSAKGLTYDTYDPKAEVVPGIGHCGM